MNNLQDIIVKCEEELNRTYRDRALAPGNHYLWYCETSESVTGNIAIAQEQPHLGWMIADKVRDSLTNDQNIKYWLSHRTLQRLPILS